MKTRNIGLNLIIILAVAGMALGTYGKLNPEFGNDFWNALGPNVRIGIATLFCLFGFFVTFPRKRLIEKRVKPILYLKPLFWFGFLIYFWYQWFSLS
ncbi:hypothetical protein RI845_00250 [Thalassotalea nanhaiensis]|uniref:Uncharacterized protein n=1 Tax=Thalassotalea nanhaiensis TaxID=3065648 RepID=A0ABY9TK15_9GAMM|nr:hypothetical protein RI845_00250 [Colwelliaceae bacterium SQ345]